MKTPYSALAVANYFLDLAKANRSSLDPMKLQKLIYFAHGWHLALYDGQPLVNEEIQAWQYGPVIQSVYHEFKQFGAEAITKLATDIDESGELVTPRIPLDDARTMALLNKIWEIYSKYSGIQLSHLTHEPNSAWSKARKDNEDFKFVGIKNNEIQEDFAKKIAA